MLPSIVSGYVHSKFVCIFFKALLAYLFGIGWLLTYYLLRRRSRPLLVLPLPDVGLVLKAERDLIFCKREAYSSLIEFARIIKSLD